MRSWKVDVLLVMDVTGEEKLASFLPQQGCTICTGDLRTGEHPCGAHPWMDFVSNVKNPA